MRRCEGMTLGFAAILLFASGARAAPAPKVPVAPPFGISVGMTQAALVAALKKHGIARAKVVTDSDPKAAAIQFGPFKLYGTAFAKGRCELASGLLRSCELTTLAGRSEKRGDQAHAGVVKQVTRALGRAPQRKETLDIECKWALGENELDVSRRTDKRTYWVRVYFGPKQQE